MRFVVVMLLAVISASAHAMPGRDEVVARNLLPRSAKQAVALLAARSEEDPATRLARVRVLLQEGRATGDTRALGLADALLASAKEDDEVQILRATIAQSRHDFAAARALLDDVLARQPRHAQALLTRATIGTVTGDYAAVAADCRALRDVHVDAGAICQAQVDAVTGAQQRAAQVLEIAKRRTSGGLLGWTLALQGQLAEQRGDTRAAIAAYRASLQHTDDLPTRLALADALLAQRDFTAVDNLLHDAPPADGVLLRRWLAEQARGRQADELRAQLEQRIADAEQRGELLHAREAARFALACGDTRRALRWAQQNWRSQREPADLAVLARTARAAGDKEVERQVSAWIARTGLVDVRILYEGKRTGGGHV